MKNKNTDELEQVTKNNSGWSLIPPPVLCRQDLSANEKIVIGRIWGLMTSQGYCYATNRWLGMGLGLTTKTVGSIISSLAKKGWIEVEVVRDQSNVVIQRRIYPRMLKDLYTPSCYYPPPPWIWEK